MSDSEESDGEVNAVIPRQVLVNFKKYWLGIAVIHARGKGRSGLFMQPVGSIAGLCFSNNQYSFRIKFGENMYDKGEYNSLCSDFVSVMNKRGLRAAALMGWTYEAPAQQTGFAQQLMLKDKTGTGYQSVRSVLQRFTLDAEVTSASCNFTNAETWERFQKAVLLTMDKAANEDEDGGSVPSQKRRKAASEDKDGESVPRQKQRKAKRPRPTEEEYPRSPIVFLPEGGSPNSVVSLSSLPFGRFSPEIPGSRTASSSRFQSPHPLSRFQSSRLTFSPHSSSRFQSPHPSPRLTPSSHPLSRFQSPHPSSGFQSQIPSSYLSPRLTPSSHPSSGFQSPHPSPRLTPSSHPSSRFQSPHPSSGFQSRTPSSYLSRTPSSYFSPRLAPRTPSSNPHPSSRVVANGQDLFTEPSSAGIPGRYEYHQQSSVLDSDMDQNLAMWSDRLCGNVPALPRVNGTCD
jgi:hypothetical protein